MLQVDSLPSESPGVPKNTGVSNLSLLWGDFPSQELNWVSCIAREGNGNPLQYSCLENPMDGGAW